MTNAIHLAPGIPVGDEAEDVATLERLIADLSRYTSGRPPTDAELAAAPCIEAWQPVVDPSACRFIGNITGHPRVGRTLGATSRIYAIDRDGGWIRTYSRLWRLGRALAREEVGPLRH